MAASSRSAATSFFGPARRGHCAHLGVFIEPVWPGQRDHLPCRCERQRVAAGWVYPRDVAGGAAGGRADGVGAPAPSAPPRPPREPWPRSARPLRAADALSPLDLRHAERLSDSSVSRNRVAAWEHSAQVVLRRDPVFASSSNAATAIVDPRQARAGIAGENR